MKIFIVLPALVALACSASVQSYGSGPATAQSSYGGDSYGQQQQQCTTFDETKYQEHCEDFEERICTTSQRESCQDVRDQACSGVVTSKQNRKCFDVTERRCTLKEDVRMETIQMPVTIQKCRKVPEQLCDTIYDTSLSRTERRQCITVQNQKCSTSKRTVQDRTCKRTFTFECESSSAYAQPEQQDSYGQDSGYGSQQQMGSQMGGYGGGDSYGNDYSAQQTYAAPKVNCRRQPEEKCYNTPRTVTQQNCYEVPEKICENLVEMLPAVQARQSCRREEKRVCELVKRSQEKQVKKYVYTKQCRDVPRQVCENADQKTLVPSCVPSTRKQCSYSPAEKCESQPRRKCFNLAYKIQRQRCEPVQQESYGQAEQTGYGDDGGYGDQGGFQDQSADAYGDNDGY